MDERKRNPLIHSAAGGRFLSASQLPLFALRPPRGYGILTTTGRVSGKRRRRCVRVARSGDRAYLEPRSFFERLEYRIWRPGRPTREGIDDLHRTWFERGTPFVVELS